MTAHDELMEATDRLWRARSALLAAVQASDSLAALAVLREPSIPRDERADLRMVALCEAARLGRDGMCASLIRDIGEPPTEYVSPLVVALDAGREDIARRLALAGVGIDQKKFGRPYPAHIAAQDGKIEILRLILDHETQVDRRATVGEHLRMTPLMAAACSGQTAAVEMLLSRGADPSLRDAEGRSAMDHAVAASQSEAQELLRPYSKSAPTGLTDDPERRSAEADRHDAILGQLLTDLSRLSAPPDSQETFWEPLNLEKGVPSQEEVENELQLLADSNDFRRLIANIEAVLDVSTKPLSFAPWLPSFQLEKSLAMAILDQGSAFREHGALAFLMSASRTKARLCIAPVNDPRYVILGLGVAAFAIEPQLLLSEIEPLLASSRFRILLIAGKELRFELRSDEVDISTLVGSYPRDQAEIGRNLFDTNGCGHFAAL